MTRKRLAWPWGKGLRDFAAVIPIYRRGSVLAVRERERRVPEQAFDRLFRADRGR